MGDLYCAGENESFNEGEFSSDHRIHTKARPEHWRSNGAPITETPHAVQRPGAGAGVRPERDDEARDDAERRREEMP